MLTIGTRPVPAAGPGEVLIRVAAAGVNGPDLKQRRGNYPPPPGALDLIGLEVSGHMSRAWATGVTDWAEGDAKSSRSPMAAAMRNTCPVPAGQCLPPPPKTDLDRRCRDL